MNKKRTQKKKNRNSLLYQYITNSYFIVFIIALIISIILYIFILKVSDEISLYKDKNEELTKEISHIKSSISHTKDDVSVEKQETSNLKVKISALKEDYERIKVKNELIEKKAKQINQMFLEVNNDLFYAKKAYEKLLEINNEYKKTINDYKSSSVNKLIYEQHKDKYERLKKQYESLIKEIGDDKPFYPDSYIVTHEHISLINKWLNHRTQPKYKLLYSLGTNRKDPRTFHELCGSDTITNTIIFIKTKKGNIFGGYTNNNWSIKGYKKDSGAFLFNLMKGEKFDVLEKEAAINTEKNFYAFFGRGDLVITDEQSYSLFPVSYRGKGKTASSLTNEDSNFEIDDMEVYQIF